MNTTYAVHEHTVPWARDTEGNDLMTTDVVVEFVPENGESSYWYMPECVGQYTVGCSMCGRTDLGEVTESGIITDDDSLTDLIKRFMGERWDYNDRLRSNAYWANKAAKEGRV